MQTREGIAQIAVFQNKYAVGYGQIGDEQIAGYPIHLGDLKDLLLTDFETDAHFCMYHVPGEPIFPRLKKEALASIRAQGSDILVQYLCLDYDLPHGADGGKQGWDRESWGNFDFSLEDILQNSAIPRPSALYTTAHGAHVMWTLDAPVSAKDAEEMLAGLNDEFLSRGLKFDALYDWTRLMRMPRVLRDDTGKKTIQDPFHFVEVHENQISEVARMPKKALNRDIEIDLTLDGVEEVDRDMPDPTVPLPPAHPLWRVARKMLAGRECFESVFGGRTSHDLGKRGSRNNNIFKYAGEVVGLLYGTGMATPERCFQLLKDAVLDCDAPPGKESPISALWRAVKTAWTRESASVAKEKKRLETRDSYHTRTNKETWESIVAGFKEWTTVPNLITDDDVRLFLSERLILITPGGGALVMQPNGYYDRHEVSKSQMISRIRHLQMDHVIDIYREEGKGKTRSGQDVADSYGYPVISLQASPMCDSGTVVHGMEGTGATAILPMFKRNKKLIPRYDPEVDLWLRKVCECDEDYEKLVLWLSHCLDFENPIAALAIIGPGGIGKKMLMMGIAECFDPVTIGDFSNIVDGFGDVLLASPFIWANEGFPKENKGKRIADILRELVAGDPISVNRKYKTPITLAANFRVIITANNGHCLTNLYEGQDLTHDDRIAIAQRLVYIKASKRAKIWLRGKGGLKYTSKEGRRWISGQTGGKSDYIVAQHFLWLYENRPEMVDGQRFLVEGSIVDNPIVDEMALSSGVAPHVIETIFSMGRQSGTVKGLLILTDGDKPGVYVSPSGVKEHYRKQPWAKDFGRVTDKRVASVLVSLSDEHGRMTVKGVVSEWYKLNMPFLVSHAERFGSEVSNSFMKVCNEEIK